MSARGGNKAAEDSALRNTRLAPIKRDLFTLGEEYDRRMGGIRTLVIRRENGIFTAWWEASKGDPERLHGGLDRSRDMAEWKLLQHIEDRLK